MSEKVDMLQPDVTKSGLLLIYEGILTVSQNGVSPGMDTTTASGELLFHVFGALAQYVFTHNKVVP